MGVESRGREGGREGGRREGGKERGIEGGRGNIAQHLRGL